MTTTLRYTGRQMLSDVHVGLLLVDKNSVLLGEQAGAAHGRYTLPMGSVQRDESLMQALMRLSEQDLGVLINVDSLCLRHVMHHAGDDGNSSSYSQPRSWMAGTLASDQQDSAGCNGSHAMIFRQA